MEEPEAQLIAAKGQPRLLKPINGPGVFWLLIILALVSLTGAMMIFGKSYETPGIAVIGDSLTPTPTEQHQARVYTVSYKSGVFSPTNLRIHSGDTVRFKNESVFPIRVVTDPHPEHNNLVGFDSIGDIPQGSYFSFTFAAKGVFGYHNENKIDEAGTIIVR